MGGLYILAIVLVAVIYTCLGYFWGKANEREKQERIRQKKEFEREQELADLAEEEGWAI